MKNLIAIVSLTICFFFASSAFADSTYICSGPNQTAQLKITDPIIKNGSYNECNGGVGDEMTDCHTHNYQIEVQYAVVALKVNDEILFSKMELSGSGSTLNGFDILIYKDLAIHATLKGDKNNPSLNLRFMAKGTPGNPAEVGSYSLSCK